MLYPKKQVLFLECLQHFLNSLVYRLSFTGIWFHEEMSFAGFFFLSLFSFRYVGVLAGTFCPLGAFRASLPPIHEMQLLLGACATSLQHLWVG